MILDLVYTSRDFYVSNQVIFRPMYLLLGLTATNLYIKNFCYLVNTLTNKANIHIKKKF